jgi:hypothetical protein
VAGFEAPNDNGQETTTVIDNIGDEVKGVAPPGQAGLIVDGKYSYLAARHHLEEDLELVAGSLGTGLGLIGQYDGWAVVDAEAA